MLSLDKLTRGRQAKVISIDKGSNCCQKLENLGLCPGSLVKKISQESSRGPVVVKVGSTQIALGHGMASKITVELL
ncbi:MAG: FeoA family protein [Candidatus Omnitrophica bacterium]|nr:FeoA family protein [Candidatus Omnitrophota bacterium]MDD5429341.1 FeoA family protein [Candidatus Omnitrophota bacterium]